MSKAHRGGEPRAFQQTPCTSEANNCFKALADNACEGITVVQGEAVEYCNTQAAKVLGYSLDEFTSIPIARHVHPDDLKRVYELLETSSTASIDLRSRHSDGTYRWLKCSLVSVSWNGHPAMIVYSSDITEQRRTEAALREDGDSRASILDAITSCVTLVDTSMRVLWANRAAIEISGLSSEDIVGRKNYELWLKTDRSCIKCPISRALRDCTTQEGIVPSSDGRIWHERAEPVFDSHGRFIGAAVIADDVTEQQKAEENAEEHAQFMDALLLALPVPVFYKDTEERFLGCNSAFEDFTGKYAEDIIGKRSEEVFPSEIGYAYDRLDAEMMLHPSAQVYETEIEDLRGRVRQVIFGKATFSRSDGTVAGLVGSWTDITEQKEAEDALRKSENDLVITLDSIGDAVIATDVEETITRVNPVAADLTGWNQEEAVGRKIRDVFRLIDAETRQAISSPLAHVLGAQSRHEPPRPTILISRDGRERQISQSGAPILDYDGRRNGSVVVFRDITEQRLMEEHFQQSQKMESIGRLAGGIAHDFNNLLGGIMGFSELMRDLVQDEPELKEYVETVMDTAEKAADLTSKLLTFSRKGINKKVSVDVNDVIGDVQQLLGRTLDKRVEISLDLHDNVPDIIGDRSLLQNALLNLGVNAGDAMPKGGTLTFATHDVELDEAYCKGHGDQIQPGPFAEISVSDTGTGIDRDTLRQIFEPFFTTKALGKGTGLGLSMVYGTVRDHGGVIDVQSRLEHGTTFRIYLPAQTEEIVPQSTYREEEIITGKGTILLADDEPVIRDMANHMLQRMGYVPILAENGQEAVDIFRKRHAEIDLVILDMMMPRMNGRDAYAEMRAIRPDVRAIISSGFSFGTEEKELLDDGFLCLVQKPYKFAQFSVKVAEALKYAPELTAP